LTRICDDGLHRFSSSIGPYPANKTKFYYVIRIVLLISLFFFFIIKSMISWNSETDGNLITYRLLPNNIPESAQGPTVGSDAVFTAHEIRKKMNDIPCY